MESYPCVFQVHCTVPVYSSGVSAMAIHPTTNNLLMVHADQQVLSTYSRTLEVHRWSYCLLTKTKTEHDVH